MGAEGQARKANVLHGVAGRLAAIKSERRRFWVLVGLAAVVHAALIIGIGRSMPRTIGAPEAAQDGISVELVDAADLDSKSSVMPEPPASAGNPAPAAPPPQPPPPPEEEKPVPPAPPEPAQEKQTTASIDKEIPNVAAPQITPPKQPKTAMVPKEQREPKEKERTKPAPERDPLQLSLPDIPSFIPGGRAAALARPPGITRSGENDEFARGVIRALRRTMPGSDRPGRVTIRLFLTEKGNIQEVQLIRSGGDPIMDQNVVFAAKQASFPLPPVGATVADRVFLVTYVYQ
jgi:protein TonB